MKIKLKKIFRNLYYKFVSGKIVDIEGPLPIKGYKWIINDRFGKAYFKNYYEPETTALFLQHIAQGDVFIDIGAHAGYFTLIASAVVKDGTVHCFEPVPENYDHVKKIIKLNCLENVKVNQAILGNHVGKIGFQEGKTSSTGKVDLDSNLKFESTTLDAYVEGKRINKIDLIKIDVEGYGSYVLEGAKKVIKKYLPNIIMEIHKGSGEAEGLRKLRAMGYSFYDITNRDVTEDLLNQSLVIAKA